MTASSDAAVVTGSPWSWAAGTKWVFTRPLVDAPQIANAPASSQKVPLRAASPSARSARPAAPVTGAGLGVNSGAP